MYESVPAVRRGLTNLARGSPITAEVALRRLGRVCDLLETTPQQLLEEAERDVKGLQDSFEDLVTRMHALRLERNLPIPA